MNCVSCKEPLVRLSRPATVRAWKCSSCQSIAAEIGSLSDSVPRVRVEALEKAIFDAPSGDRACPKCGLFMRRGPVRGGYGTIEVDGCVPCRIAWFDQGELKSLRAGFGPDGSQLPSSMTPDERHAWRMNQIRESGLQYEEDMNASILALVLRIPLPEPVRGHARTSWTTWGLAALVTVTSVAGFVTGVQTTALRFGLIPAHLDRGRMVTLVTHFFVHADPFHLMGNLAYFIVFGTRVEALIGPARFGCVILLATIAGGLAHAAGAPDPSIPLIGASGGISGVIAAYVSLRPRSTIRMMLWYQLVRIPAYAYFVFWIVLQMVGAAAQLTHMSAVSALGHLGGAAVGFLLGFAWRSRAEAVDAAAAQCR